MIGALAHLKRLFSRRVPARVEPITFDRVSLRRANARRYLRLRGITRVKGVYGSPEGF
jgi:hypothetical protein